MSFSLDGGATFSNTLSVSFGYVRRVKVAFLYVGPISDFGWCADEHAPSRGVLARVKLTPPWLPSCWPLR
jgi:hypothetical protein